MIDTTLKIPFGLDEKDRPVSAEKAERLGAYRCPNCKSDLILKQGQIREWHFAHKVTIQCSLESVLHKTAKYLVRNSLREWVAGNKQSPLMQRTCCNCSKSTAFPLPQDISNAEVEQRTSSNFVVDVGIFVGSSIEYAVEIKHTHAMNDRKIQEIGIAFIELIAEEVISDPWEWKPVLDEFPEAFCSDCADIQLERRALLRAYSRNAARIAEKFGFSLPTKFYRFAIWNCWQCDEKIIVFTWPKHHVMHEPIPQTIQLRQTMGMEKAYFANVCPKCNSVQGDYHMNNKRGAPFFGLDMRGMSPRTYEADMQKIIERKLT